MRLTQVLHTSCSTRIILNHSIKWLGSLPRTICFVVVCCLEGIEVTLLGERSQLGDAPKSKHIYMFTCRSSCVDKFIYIALHKAHQATQQATLPCPDTASGRIVIVLCAFAMFVFNWFDLCLAGQREEHTN